MTTSADHISADGLWSWDGARWVLTAAGRTRRFGPPGQGFLVQVEGDFLKVAGRFNSGRVQAPLALVAGATVESTGTFLMRKARVVLIGGGTQLGYAETSGQFALSAAQQAAGWITTVAGGR